MKKVVILGMCLLFFIPLSQTNMNAQKLLNHFRETEQLVIHVRHNSTLATLSGTYAEVTDTAIFLQNIKK